MCDLNVVETENHFLLHCPYYNDQRNSLFVKIGYDANLFYFNDSTFRPIDIVNNFPRQTANFIHNCYNIISKTKIFKETHIDPNKHIICIFV